MVVLWIAQDLAGSSYDNQSFGLVLILTGDVSLLKGSEEVDDCCHITLSAYLKETKDLDAKDEFCLMDGVYLLVKERTVVLEYKLYGSLPRLTFLGLDPFQNLPIDLVIIWTLFYLNKCFVVFLWGIAGGNIEAEDVSQHQYVLDLLDILVDLSCEG